MSEKRNPIGKNLNALINDRSITQSAIAAVSGATEGAVSHWIAGRSWPSEKYLQRIADYYKIDIDDITSDTSGYYAKLHGLTSAPAGAIAPATPRKAYAPLYGRVHAGEATEPDLLEDKIPIPYEVWENHKQGYFLEVEGDCMDKVYPPGCLVFIDPTMTPQNRSIAVVSIDGADYIMRRLNKGASTLLLSPESNNSDWQDIVIQGDKEVRMVGTVVWFQPIKELE